MRSNISLYLEFLRWLAATGVLVAHFGHFIAPGIPSRISGHGSECVAIFFVLSGFVIRFVQQEKEKNWFSYAKARFVRLASVVPLAILSAAVLEGVGFVINRGFYLGQPWYNPTWGLLDIISTVTFTNEQWFRHVIVASNEPYWSLGFEVPYYIAFGIFCFSEGSRRIIFSFIWLLFFGLKIAAFAPLWLLGVLTFNIVNSQWIVRMNRGIGWIFFAASLLAYPLVKYLIFKGGAAPMFAFSDLGSFLRTLVYFHLVGLCVALNIVSVAIIMEGRPSFWPKSLTITIRWLAGSSFTIYLFHEPFLIFLSAVFPAVRGSMLGAVFILVGTYVYCLVMAELGERRKYAFRTMLEGALDRISGLSIAKLLLAAKER